MSQPTPKVIGAMKHLLLELIKVNVINEGDRDHLLDRYIRGRINSFGHMAEYMNALYPLGRHNYVQVLQYGNHYGENNYLYNSQGKSYLTDPNKPVD